VRRARQKLPRPHNRQRGRPAEGVASKIYAIRLHTGAGLGMLPRHMSNKSSGTSEGAGDGVERPEDAEVEGAQRSETQGPETDDAADEDSDDEAKSEKAKSEPASKRDDD